MQQEIGYAIIGTGYFGKRLAEIINNMQGARVKAIYDPDNYKEVTMELECDVEPSVDSLVKRGDVDAVVVSSPNYLHKSSVLKAAEQKKDIFCEKPIALSYKDCQDMINSTNNNNVIFMAGHVMHFMNGVKKVKSLINQGEIGEVLFCHASRTGWKERNSNNIPTWKDFNKFSGGQLYHHIHELDFVQFIMGPAKKVYMSGGNVAHHDKNSGDENDLLLMTLEFENNSFATLKYGSAFRHGEHYVEIQGTKGSILIDLQDARVIVKTLDRKYHYLLHESAEEDEDRRRIYSNSQTDGGIVHGKPTDKPPEWLNSIMKKEMHYFHSLIDGATPDSEYVSLTNGIAASNAIATADALTLSLQEDKKVNIEEIF